MRRLILATLIVAIASSATLVAAPARATCVGPSAAQACVDEQNGAHYMLAGVVTDFGGVGTHDYDDGSYRSWTLEGLLVNVYQSESSGGESRHTNVYAQAVVFNQFSERDSCTKQEVVVGAFFPILYQEVPCTDAPVAPWIGVPRL